MADGSVIGPDIEAGQVNGSVGNRLGGLFMAGATVYLPLSLQYIWLGAALVITGIFGDLFLIPVVSFSKGIQ